MKSKIKEIQNFKYIAHDKETNKIISFSQYQLYSQCQHKWYLQYQLKKGIQMPNMNLTFGTAIHVSIQEYLKTMYEVSGKAADEMDVISLFEKTLKEEYTKQLESNGNVHFSTKKEFTEYYEDGVEILNWFKKHRKEYFSIRGYELVGIEIPLLFNISPTHPNILFKGSIDFILYDEKDEKFIIIDFKTSRQGWKDKDKQDEIKMQQLILYKEYFSKLFNIDVDHIDVQFFILKRKIWENSDYVQKRVQTHEPASGKGKRNKAHGSILKFIQECFNADNSYVTERTFEKSVTPLCKYCQYNNTPDCTK